MTYRRYNFTFKISNQMFAKAIVLNIVIVFLYNVNIVFFSPLSIVFRDSRNIVLSYDSRLSSPAEFRRSSDCLPWHCQLSCDAMPIVRPLFVRVHRFLIAFEVWVRSIVTYTSLSFVYNTFMLALIFASVPVSMELSGIWMNNGLLLFLSLSLPLWSYRAIMNE